MSYTRLQSHWHAAEAPTGTEIFSHIIWGRGLFLKTRRGDLRVLTVLDWNVWLFPRLWLRDTGFQQLVRALHTAHISQFYMRANRLWLHKSFPVLRGMFYLRMNRCACTQMCKRRTSRLIQIGIVWGQGCCDFFLTGGYRKKLWPHWSHLYRSANTGLVKAQSTTFTPCLYLPVTCVLPPDLGHIFTTSI